MDKSTIFKIDINLRGFHLVFDTTYDLFSYRKIDDGSQLLINTLQVGAGDVCLDLGCGYGAVGIVMAKQNPTGKVYFVDRDFVAVEFSKKNCLKNSVKNFDVRLSNGFSNLDDIMFDTIASNLPTHVAKEMLELMILEAKHHLKSNGRFYVVTVNRLRPYIQRELEEFFGNYERVSQNNNYTISLAVCQPGLK